MAVDKATYTHGHHQSVVQSHARRTAEDSAAFLLPHIKPDSKILDLGCGPGSITIGLARYAARGHVTGGDVVEAVVEQARALANEQAVPNVSFQQLDGKSLPFVDGQFDIVFAHQVVQHVGDPVGMLKEMRRVTKAGGLLAVRDADYRTFAWWPENPGLDKWITVYDRVAKANLTQPDAGRYLVGWARQAGFARADIEFTWSAWNYQGEQARAFGQAWSERALYSGFADSAKQHDLATQDELQDISRAWEEWSNAEDCFVIIPSGEVLCRVH